MATEKTHDVIIIGGGQSGLACAYFMRRTKLDYVILDEQIQPGGAWNQTWDSLKIFSPAEHSSLPGWMMPKAKEEYPGKNHVIKYLSDYESRYKLPVERGIEVNNVTKQNDVFRLETSRGIYKSRALISATGTWKQPFIPEYPGINNFNGQQLHSAFYKNPDQLKGEKILIVGGGNSGAQILAEVSKTHKPTWVTLKEPKFLPDEVDGRYLFEFATKQYKARLEGKQIKPAGTLGDIVMVESVKEARDRDALKSQRPFKSIYESGVIWEDGSQEQFDTIIWCTGFKASLKHLNPLINDSKISTKGTKATEIDGLWLVGYGSWTGYASATLIGVGRTARQTIKEVADYLK